jgi:hypothetical protein
MPEARAFFSPDGVAANSAKLTGAVGSPLPARVPGPSAVCALPGTVHTANAISREIIFGLIFVSSMTRVIQFVWVY